MFIHNWDYILVEKLDLALYLFTKPLWVYFFEYQFQRNNIYSFQLIVILLSIVDNKSIEF